MHICISGSVGPCHGLCHHLLWSSSLVVSELAVEFDEQVEAHWTDWLHLHCYGSAVHWLEPGHLVQLSHSCWPKGAGLTARWLCLELFCFLSLCCDCLYCCLRINALWNSSHHRPLHVGLLTYSSACWGGRHWLRFVTVCLYLLWHSSSVGRLGVAVSRHDAGINETAR